MAQYCIKNLNYITSGNNRTLINIDTGLNVNDFYDYIHLLAIEDFKDRPDARLSDVLLEQHGADFYKTKFIEICKTVDPSLSTRHPEQDDIDGDIFAHEQYWNSILSTECSALALEGSSSDKILLNEQQQYYNDLSSRNDKWIRLYLSCCTDDFRKKVLDYYNKSLKYSETYVIEHNQLNEEKNKVTGQETTCPLYAFKDVAVKSSNKLNRSNMLCFDDISPTRTEDYYLPDSAQPKEFCQADDTTYLITVGTNESPQYLTMRSSTTDVSQHHYTMQLSSEDLRTHLYNSYEEANVTSFADYFQLSTASVAEFYKVRKNIPGVEYSYIVELPMSNIVGKNQYTNYDNGNIYANLLNSKSMYNSTYQMQMSSDEELQNCRQYADVFTCGGKPYLKFIDNVSYHKGTSRMSMKTASSKVSYPKIESLVPLASQTSKAHKSYFFSVNIRDVGSDIQYDEEEIKQYNGKKHSVDQLKKEIQHDITQAIRQIADNVCPVQSQLFEVQFGNNAQL